MSQLHKYGLGGVVRNTTENRVSFYVFVLKEGLLASALQPERVFGLHGGYAGSPAPDRYKLAANRTESGSILLRVCFLLRP